MVTGFFLSAQEGLKSWPGGGCRYSYAECITTPFLRRALVNLDAHRGLNVLALARAKGLQRLSDWMVVGYSLSTPLIQSCKKFKHS
jgi:hypothetical protein